MAERINLPDGTSATIEDLIRHAWTTGEFLEERYDPLQLALDQMYDALPPRTRAFLLEARKIGKTFGLLARADKMSRKVPSWITRFAYPTQKQGKTIIGPIMEEMQEDCPPDLRWVNREQQDACWMLPHTGARLYLAGTDDAKDIDRLRGPKSNFNVLDEVTTFGPNLQRLLDSVMWPQTLTTGGITLLSGTAPESLDHPSMVQIERARRTGRLIVKTIFDNPRLTADDIYSICTEANPLADHIQVLELIAGKATGTPMWEREFLCKLIPDANARVAPEFDEHTHVGPTFQNRFDLKFVFIDPGHTKDFFGVVFCSLNFAEQRLYVHADYASLRQNTDTIKAHLVEIERKLGWHDQLVTRYIDQTGAQQATDFNSKGYRVQLAMKSPGKGQLVVEMRNHLNATPPRIIINPKCGMLIEQLTNGIWSSTLKEDFKRSAVLGHLDCLDALAQGCLILKLVAKWSHNTTPKTAYYDEQRESIRYNELQRLTGPSKTSIMIGRALFGRGALGGRKR